MLTVKSRIPGSEASSSSTRSLIRLVAEMLASPGRRMLTRKRLFSAFGKSCRPSTGMIMRLRPNDAKARKRVSERLRRAHLTISV